MRIAYFIPIHLYPNLFKRMFRAIYDPSNLYLLHIDKKSEDSFKTEIRDFIADYPNVYLMPSYDCVYAGYSTLDIDLKAIRELLKHEWDFFINISGQDFPLKTQAFIKDYLRVRRHNNFVQILDMEKQWRKTRFRVHWYFVELKLRSALMRRKRTWPLPIPRSYPKQYRRYGGSAWCILNREFCEYLTFNHAHDKLKRFLEHTYIPEEEFFQTVIMHSPFKDTVINDNKRLIVWRRGKILGWHYSRMRPFELEDAHVLDASDAFFARKFSESSNSELLDHLESRLLVNEEVSVDEPLVSLHLN